MKLQDIFIKPVDRNIEGVIKADDESSLKMEVEEYVITNEVAQRIEHFLEAYNNYQKKNGSWISGFFGSGKSHLLKMLALLLENRKVDGVPVLELFLPKCEDNKILQGSLQKAVSIPSKSILFNIDQKADVISKKEVDALLAVFLKVFNESCGYYGKLGYVAQFERELDKKGLYDKFKKVYSEISGKDWALGREETSLESKNISIAYAKVTGNDEHKDIDFVKNSRADYSVSIEDFANLINDYVQSQGKDFRLNFFVDEVGQYIADNIKLMTNLQTIAESLATKCNGRSWLIVTAQEDMNTVVGELGKHQGNDFSKIMARFDSKMKLSSQNVDEVIQKRLLKKNDKGNDLLLDIYSKESNNFKTLFDFSDGATTYRNFADSDHFVNSYPFIPYQYSLFQQSIENLSMHNAFEGKHSSVGERSMLGVFQEVVKKIAGNDVGELSTFDLMFEGIRTTLKRQMQSAIILAENNLENPFAIRVLKALLLVKYVKGFNATVRNITVLMHNRFDRDLKGLRKDVEEALNLLEQETYVRRNVDLYEYLTDDEKDVEAEIKDTDVDTADLITFLGENIFDGIIRDKKIRYTETAQDYIFTRKLDEKLFGKAYELGIQIITPFNDDAENFVQLKMRSMGSSELMVIMPPDARFVQDVQMYLRTKKYIDLNINTSQKDSVRRILEEKRRQNDMRKQDIERKLRELLGKAAILVSGDELNIKGTDAKLRITTAFQELVKRTYPNLKMIQGTVYTEGMLKGLLNPDDSMFKSDAVPLTEAEQEVLNSIRQNSLTGNRSTVKFLVDKFEKKPYGWYLAGILGQVSKLWGRGSIDARESSNILTSDDVESALLNTHGYQRIYLDLVDAPDPVTLQKVKSFISNFFNRPVGGADQKTMGGELSGSLDEMYHNLEKMSAQMNVFPFLQELEDPLKLISANKAKPYSHYFKTFLGDIDKLLEYKSSIIEPITQFMNGKQKEIYSEGRNLLEFEQDNLTFIDGEEARELKGLLDDPACFKNNTIPKVKSITERLKKKINDLRKKELSAAKEKLEEYKQKIIAMPAYKKAEATVKKEIDVHIDSVEKSMDSTESIAMIRNRINTFMSDDYPHLLNLMNKKSGGDDGIKVISIKSISIDTEKSLLATEEDVDAYLGDVKKSLMKVIKKNNQVSV